MPFRGIYEVSFKDSPNGNFAHRHIGCEPYEKDNKIPPEDNEMSMRVRHYPEEDRLDLTIEENLDLTLTRQILEARRIVDHGLITCVIDCTRITRVFDSGLALIILLSEKLREFGVRLVVIGEIPGLSVSTLQVSGVRHVSTAIASRHK